MHPCKPVANAVRLFTLISFRVAIAKTSKGLRVKAKSTLCAFHERYYTHRKNFCKSFFQKIEKKFFAKFSFSVHFSLDKRKFLRFVHFSLDIIAKPCPSKFGVFPPFRDSIYYYRLTN